MSHSHSHEPAHGPHAKDIVHKLGEGVAEVKEHLSRVTHQSPARTVEEVSDRISKNPLLSVAIALGVGYALGLAKSRFWK